jgi:hypothetical protein
MSGIRDETSELLTLVPIIVSGIRIVDQKHAHPGSSLQVPDRNGDCYGIAHAHCGDE